MSLLSNESVVKRITGSANWMHYVHTKRGLLYGDGGSVLQYSCLEYRCFMSMILGFQDRRAFCLVSDRWRREQMNKDRKMQASARSGGSTRSEATVGF